MATNRRRSFKDFSCTVNGEEYRFKCYTTDTRNGFCHTVESLDYDVPDTKVSYCNRNWESFQYETALRGMIRKFPKGMQEAMTRQLIDGEAAAEHDRCEAQFAQFKGLYDGLNAENKERMTRFPTLQSESDVRACMGFMALLNLMQQ